MILNLILTSMLAFGQVSNAEIVEGITNYNPSSENLASREKFSDDKFGIFIHWGVYSMLGRGEWVLNNDKLLFSDYSILPGGFYPGYFNAEEWVKAIKGAGARYLTITSRHHDGFSMFKSEFSDFNIVDATPFGRDVLKELADACQKHGITLNFYYSLTDWGREDYPVNREGKFTGRDTSNPNYESYLDFMCNQITELLTNYGPIGCIWFDGDWDQILKKEDGSYPDIDFDWQYGRIYELIHKLQPNCLVANNHHRLIIPGEDIQVFERDVPGENTAGYSRTDVVSNALPLETCQTMNRSWGFDLKDHSYKSAEEMIRLLVRTAGRNANLLLNVGPQPDGRIPAMSLERMAQIGKWMEKNGESIYGTRSTLLKPQPWGVVTEKDNKIYLHVMEKVDGGSIVLPLSLKIGSISEFASGSPLKFKRTKKDVTISLPESYDYSLDYIIEITLK